MRKLPARLPYKVQLYDGNWSYYPNAYCRTHGAYLTQGLIDTHKCQQRECQGLEWLNEKVKDENS